MLTTEEAVAITGMKTDEIVELGDSPAGTLIHCADKSTLIYVDEVTPDGEGKSGLMYLVAPHDPYTGALPLYAQPAGDEPIAVLDATPLAAEPAPEPEASTEEVAAPDPEAPTDPEPKKGK